MPTISTKRKGSMTAFLTLVIGLLIGGVGGSAIMYMACVDRVKRGGTL